MVLLTQSKIRAAIKQQKNKKAPGQSGIVSNMYKFFAHDRKIRMKDANKQDKEMRDFFKLYGISGNETQMPG